MDLADWRDVALWIIGFFHAVFAAAVGAIFFFTWRYSRKGFNLLDQVVDQRVRPALDATERQLLAVRDRTARLPGSRGIGLGEAPAPKKSGFSLPVPFKKKRRRFPFLPS
jgi:hypothetical protein